MRDGALSFCVGVDRHERVGADDGDEESGGGLGSLQIIGERGVAVADNCTFVSGIANEPFQAVRDGTLEVQGGRTSGSRH